MNPENWINLGILVIAGGGALSAVAWRIVLYVARVERDAAVKIEGVANSLDAKFNKLRDEISDVKDKYVRRDDLMQHLGRFDIAQRDTLTAINQLRDRIDQFVEARK